MDANELVRKAGEALSVGRAFGPAYEHDGTLVVPVAIVAGGSGGGVRGAPRPAAGAATGGDTAGADAGGGFGGLVYPIGAYVVRDGEARFVPSVDVNLIVVCALLGFRLLLGASWKRRAYRSLARWALTRLPTQVTQVTEGTEGAPPPPRRVRR